VSIPSSQLPVHGWLSEPELAFHPDRAEDRHIHPLRGLLQFGPYSRSLHWVIDPIRVAAITPHGYLAKVDRLLSELEQNHRPRERTNYLPDFPTFSRLFGLRVVPAPSARVELRRELDAELAASPTPHLMLAETITRALSTLEGQRTGFDVLVIVLPERWEAAFNGRPDEDFDLHDYLKAVTAVRSVPTQIVRENGGLNYYCRCSAMWRLGIALYCKAGGVPWKLAGIDPGTAYIGLGYAMKSAKGAASRYVTCCSQVFDADGAGLEFIAYETDEARVDRDNPFLSRADTLRLISRSLSLYQHRHPGRLPTRLIIHKSTEFKKEEIDGCFDAWSRSEGLELVQIQQDVSWQGVKIDPPKGGKGTKGSAASYPVDRGTFLQIGELEVLLWTQGNARQAVTHGNFFKEGKGIPHPILLRRFAGHGYWEEGCRHVLALTKMNWNNDSLYDRMPVTMRYAQVLAQTVRRMPQIKPRPYQFRFFM
jgi:hypothetical protein